MGVCRHQLPVEIRRRAVESLSQRRPRVLTWGRTEDAYVLGTPEALVIAADEVTIVPWHRIDRGGWDQQSSTLSWTTDSGRSEVVLTKAGRLPELVRERIEASFLARQTLELAGGREVTLMVRRHLGADDAPCEFRVTADTGVNMSDPVVATKVRTALRQLRDDYGL